MAVLKDLKAELANAQAKIAALEAAAKAGTKADKVTLGSYQGSPTITFEGSFKPFSIGLSKARVMTRNAAVIERFIKSEGKSI